MSRKKVKKEVVKRKTSIYDPMGVYGRGLTENQRRGMTRRMKIENIRDQKKVLTKRDLEEYQKTLIYYGIPTVNNFHIRTINIIFPIDRMVTDVTNEKINRILQDQYGIHANAFYCDSFSIINDPEIYDFWIPFFQPFVDVGDSGFTINRDYDDEPTDERTNYVLTFPSYWIDGTTINYYSFVYDDDRSYASIKPAYENVFGDFTLLPRDSTMIPYLMFPNDNYPRMHFGVNAVGAIVSGLSLAARIRVIY